jgi:hypothetical protein
MAYFSNGTQAGLYEERYCSRCIHGPRRNPGKGCAVWLLHLIHNYDCRNVPDNMLDTLIPRTKDGLENEQCAMLIEDHGLPDPRQETLL